MAVFSGPAPAVLRKLQTVDQGEMVDAHLTLKPGRGTEGVTTHLGFARKCHDLGIWRGGSRVGSVATGVEVTVFVSGRQEELNEALTWLVDQERQLT